MRTMSSEGATRSPHSLRLTDGARCRSQNARSTRWRNRLSIRTSCVYDHNPTCSSPGWDGASRNNCRQRPSSAGMAVSSWDCRTRNGPSNLSRLADSSKPAASGVGKIATRVATRLRGMWWFQAGRGPPGLRGNADKMGQSETWSDAVVRRPSVIEAAGERDRNFGHEMTPAHAIRGV